LDPNLKTESDNEREIRQIIGDQKNEEIEAENDININYNSTNNNKFSEKIRCAEYSYENKKKKNLTKRIKEEIDLKILDLKNLNNIVKNKFEEVGSIKKTKTSIKKNKKEEKIDNENFDEVNNKIKQIQEEEVKAIEEEEIGDKKPKSYLTLTEVNLINSKSKSEKKVSQNLEIKNNNFSDYERFNYDEDIYNSNSNLKNFPVDQNTPTNLNKILNADLSCNSRNKNQSKLENKKTGDFTAMNSFAIDNFNNPNAVNFNNNLNLINTNINNYLFSNETDNEQVLIQSVIDNNNFNINALKEDEDNGYNSKNLVLNSVINLNELDSFAANEDLSNNKAYCIISKSARLKSISENIQGIFLKNNQSFEKEYLNSMENRRIKSSENNKLSPERRQDRKYKSPISCADPIDEISNKVLIKGDPIKAKENNYNFPEEKNIENLEKENKNLKKDSSLSAKSRSRNKQIRIANEGLNKYDTGNYLIQRKSFLEDFEYVNDNININNKNFNDKINKSVNSEDEIINKKNP
jgi:hypothetical protein